MDGKSFPGSGPTGPALVTLDEVDDPDDLEISATLNGGVVQASSTKDMTFPVPHAVRAPAPAARKRRAPSPTWRGRRGPSSG
ncbi:fumarylacetoacetate hydrolase family protein [Lentzea guizhouensis]|uniref:fumarylacetoacetate hydrolase family protein n=1 Tax=Lentzea guizhouensis TaxID=1586287 RepID=UPI0014762EF2